MDIITRTSKENCRELLERLVAFGESHRGLRVHGTVAIHQFIIRITKARFSLPWRGVFRGAMVARENGTLVTGKFDSNWSLHFIGYPTVIGVVLNFAATGLVTGNAFRVPVSGWFVAAACGLCIALGHLDRRDRRYITESIREAIARQLVSD